MSCDLRFDESEIAPELRKGNYSVDTPDSRRGKEEEESPPLNSTNLETVGIDEGASRILSTPPQNNEKEIIEATVKENHNQGSIYNKT